VRHDADARGVLVDQDMVRLLVRTLGEDVRGVSLIMAANGYQTRHDRFDEPIRQRGIYQLVVDQVGGPGL
jgi:hypothetical protein